MEIYLELIKYLIPAVLTGIVTVWIFKLKSSLVKLKKKTGVLHVMTSIDHPTFGEFQLFHNKKKISDVFLISIDIENTSNKDVDNLPINIVVPEDCIIISSESLNNDTQIPLKEHEEYNSIQQRDNPNWLERSMKFDCSVLNRKTSVTISVLVETLDKEITVDDINEEMSVSIEKIGVRLVNYDGITAESLGWGTVKFGMLFTIVSALIVLFFFPQQWVIVCIMGIVGLINFFVGVAIFASINGWNRTFGDDDD